jgi:hypothetical protein
MKRYATAAFNLAFLLGATALSFAAFRWLWLEYTLYGCAASAFLLFGGAQLLPSRQLALHSISLGLLTGAAVGTFVGAAGALS